MDRLHGGVDRLGRKKRRAVAAALEERHSRDHGVTHKRVQREAQGAVHQTVNHQAMLVRVDVRISGVGDDEVQAVRGKRAIDQMVRCASVLSPRKAIRIAERARHALLVTRRRTVRLDEVARHAAPGRVNELLCDR